MTIAIPIPVTVTVTVTQVVAWHTNTIVQVIVGANFTA
jgi:hypothetical protein